MCSEMIWIVIIDGAVVEHAASDPHFQLSHPSVSVPQQTLQVRSSGVRWGQPNRSG